MKEKLKYVSNNMKSYRARLGYWQEDMAEFLGISIEDTKVALKKDLQDRC